MVLLKWLCCLLLLFPCFSYAGLGSIHIFPVVLSLDSGQTKTSFKVNNTGDEPVTFQLKVVKWEQINGEDVYTDTKDIILNPPILSIQPGEYQLIRLGTRTKLDPLSEHSYRIFLTQKDITPDPDLSQDQKSSETLQASIKPLIEFRIPLFVAPKEKQKDILFGLKTAKDGQMQLHLQNVGNQHLRLSLIDLYADLQQASFEPKNGTAGADIPESLYTQNGVGYILPNSEKTIPLAWKKPQDMKEVVIKLKTDWGNLIEVDKQSS